MTFYFGIQDEISGKMVGEILVPVQKLTDIEKLGKNIWLYIPLHIYFCYYNC